MKGKWNRKGTEGRKDGRREGRKEGRKKEFREKEKKMSSVGFKPVRSVLVVFLSVKLEGVCGGIGFSFRPS